MNILLTGHSRGLGAALADECLSLGHRVYGLSRSSSPREHANLTQAQADFAHVDRIEAQLNALLPATVTLDLALLNAGVLGPIAALHDTPVNDLREVMEINVWANKIILDWLLMRPEPVAQLILLSSGASLSGNYGWGAYALSKASLNMLTRLYAQEMFDTHLTALAPGLVDTDMQKQIRRYSARDFPSLKRLHDAVGSSDMPGPATVAKRLIAALPELRALPSGQYVDLRQFKPEQV